MDNKNIEEFERRQLEENLVALKNKVNEFEIQLSKKIKNGSYVEETPKKPETQQNTIYES